MEEFKLALAEFNYTDEELNDMFRKMVRNMCLLSLCILISPLTLAVIIINSHLAEIIEGYQSQWCNTIHGIYSSHIGNARKSRGKAAC